MAGKSWSANTSDSVAIEGNRLRDGIIIQSHSDSSNAVFVQFGQPAETNKGLELGPGKDHISITGKKAKDAVHMITDSGTANGGYEEQF